MFGVESKIVKYFQISKTKCAYLINYGIAPYLKDNLLKDIKDSPSLNISLNETLNRVVQEEHMDVQIRYFKDGSVSTRLVLLVMIM